MAKERKRRPVKPSLPINEVELGVGDGTGQLFVRGSYESIKVLQDKLLEYERLKSFVAALKKSVGKIDLEKLTNLAKRLENGSN
jgi:hypothetical protein